MLFVNAAKMRNKTNDLYPHQQGTGYFPYLHFQDTGYGKNFAEDSFLFVRFCSGAGTGNTTCWQPPTCTTFRSFPI